MVKKIFVVSALAVLAVVASMQLASGNEGKVRICHATNSASNPYVSIEVDYSAVDGDKKNDHSHHTGPVFDSAVHDQQNRGWGDIIPPVDGVTDGLNWPEGQGVYDNDCTLATDKPTEPSEVVSTEPSEVESSEPSESPEPSETIETEPTPEVKPTVITEESEAPVEELTPAVKTPPQELARTGVSTDVLFLLAIILIATGVAVTGSRYLR